MKHFHTKSAGFELCDFLVVRVKLKILQERENGLGRKRKLKAKLIELLVTMTLSG